MIIVVFLCLVIIIILLALLLFRQHHIVISNKDDVLKGMELERRKREYREYLESYYYDTMPPPSVKDRYKEIEKEVLGHYLD